MMLNNKLKTQIEKLNAWYKTPLGTEFLNLEKSIVHNISLDLFGHDILVIGNHNFTSAISYKFNTKPIFLSRFDNDFYESENNISKLLCQEDKISIESHSIDIVYLAHSLEFVLNPHEVLREVYRVLKPEGYLIISCFNSFSIWGIAKYFMQITRKAPWFGKFQNKSKVIDWLQLLGFDVLKTQNYYHNLPLNFNNYIEKTNFINKVGKRFNMPLGANFIILANKRVETLTPVMPNWKVKRTVFSQGSIVEPTSLK